MVLDISQARKKIESPSPKFIQEAQEKHVRLRVHYTGDGLDDYLQKIEGAENDSTFKQRRQAAQSIKHIIHNLLRPVDKVWEARGGSFDLQTSGDQSLNLLKSKIANVNHGLSHRKYLKQVVSPRTFHDPSGFFLMEWDNEETKPFQYSITDVHDYKINGRDLDYIVFKSHRRKRPNGEPYEGTFHRVIDAEKDVTYYSSSNRFEPFVNSDGEVEMFVNPWGRVPALLNSNILSEHMNFMESPMENIMELADKYLRTLSIKNVHEFLHGFPFFWMYARNCSTCKGHGEVGGDVVCSSCGGSGKMLKKDVTDVYLLNPPTEQDQPTIAPDIAGYVTPPLDIPKEQREELNWLESLMNFTMWGAQQEKKQGKSETATGRFIDVAPVNARLKDISEIFEEADERLITFIGEFELSDAFKSVASRFGDVFITQDPDILWKEYEAARKEGVSSVQLDRKILKYYESTYKNNPMMLAIVQKEIRLEPLFHYDVNNLPTNIDNQTKIRKLYFREFWKTLSNQEKMVLNDEQLINLLDAFIEQKNPIIDVEPPTPPIQED